MSFHGISIYAITHRHLTDDYYTLEADEARCLDYFKAQYQERINRVLLKKSEFVCYGKPDAAGRYYIPDPDHFDPSRDDRILPFLLNDTAFYHSLIPRFLNRWTADQDGPDVVWEAFAVYAEEYVELQKGWGTLATSDQAGCKLTGILTYDPILRSGEYVPDKFEALVQEIARLSSEDKNGQTMAVNLIQLRMQQLQQKLPNVIGLAREKPMFFGLQHYVNQKLHRLMQIYLRRSLHSLPSSSTSAANILSAGSSIPLQRDVILFSTAGTGKTYQILKDLNSRWGMYTVAPNVQPSSDGSSLLQPTRGGASSDTLSLFKDLKSLHRTELSGIEPLVQSLKCARLSLWETFINMDMGSYSTDYARWTQLQVSCSKYSDPFDATWRLLRLHIDPSSSESICESEANMRVWCVDEAQSAFDDPLAEEILRHLWDRYCEAGEESFRILSGTSLQLEKAKAFLPKRLFADGGHLPGRNDLGQKVQFVTDLGLITSDNFWTFFHGYFDAILTETNASKGRPLLARAGRSLDFTLNITSRLQQDLRSLSSGQCMDPNVQGLHSLLATECTFFFGRYQFSTLLVEHILQQAQESGYLNKAVIKRAIQKATETAVAALWNQLDKIQDTSWVEDLYWMAIRADIYSQSSIVTDKTARLVSEGFAIVKSMTTAQTSSSQIPSANVRHGRTEAEEQFVEVVLCEPLAVYAVIKYLRESGEYDGWMHRFFSLLQIDDVDQGAIGKLAEYIISCKLDNFLSNDPQPIGRLRKSNDTIGIHRRTKLYEILSKAYRLDLSNNTWVQDTMNLQNVFLLGHKVNTATESSTELMPWLQGITNSDHSRFFFPKKKDGPDLLFVLGQKNTKLLCVLQLKTGKDEHQPAKVKEAMWSLVKGLKGGLYSTYTGPIIFINVATSTSKAIDIKKFCTDTGDMLLPGGYPVRQGHDYFGFIDGTSSPEVWGDTFYELIKLMKGMK